MTANDSGVLSSKGGAVKYLRIWIVAAAALSCLTVEPAAYAVEPSDGKTWLRDREGVGVIQLDQVRAGTPTPVTLPPVTLSVILWDEARVPAPPVRNSTLDAVVTGELNA